MSIDYQLAGFPDENGNLGRAVPAGQIVVPQKVWLDDDCIRWRMGKEPRLREVSRNTLNWFLRLTDAQSVLDFANEWGVLALSSNLSVRHADRRYYLPGRQRMREGAEPVSAWQYYSKRAQAVLNVAAALKQGRLGDLSDWGEFAIFATGPSSETMKWIESNFDRHVFGLGFRVICHVTPEERVESARKAIGGEIEGWLECWKKNADAGVSDFALRWLDDQQRWDFQINYHGLLFPAIALQLALVLADADSLYSCSGCGIPYIRPRERKRPKSGWANYCDQCSKDGVAQRRAVESYRGKRAEAVRLHLGGVPIPEIAKQLKTDATRIHMWLKKDGKDAETKTRK